MSTVAWNIALQHATQNEYLYREEFVKNKPFYVSVLDDYHRRFQMFVQSFAFGNSDKLRRSQLHFETLCNEIELFEYSVRTPSWILKRNKPEPTQSALTYRQSNDPSNKRSRPNNIRSTSGEKVVNNNIDPQMRPPASIRFGAIFNPTNREKIPSVPHPDGIEKCNNFHHRGFC